MKSLLVLAIPALLSAQLIPPGQPIPKGPNPPVVFLNGYQASCLGSSFAGTFGNADQVLQANQTVSLFFDNCTLPNKPSIETLGAAFGQFLAGLRYADGSPVSQVDVVMHSMGGLILRSYLSGKLDASPAAYTPPVTHPIRKAVFLATPHFGSAVASQFGSDKQAQEMTLGSQFLFDLATWNQGLEDLRGIDALAVAGSAGTGFESTIKNFDDGVVTLTSGSIGFVYTGASGRSGRTRVVSACHTGAAAFICEPGAANIAEIKDATTLAGRIIVSFLSGTTAWQTLGEAVETNALGAANSGLIVQAEDQTGLVLPISGATVVTPGGTRKLSTNGAAYSEALPAAVKLLLSVQAATSFDGLNVDPLPKGTVQPLVVKSGPVIKGAVPAGSAVYPLNVTSGAFVAIFGANLAGSTLKAAAVPYPTQLADVQVKVGASAVPIQFVSPGQINILFPDLPPGLVKLTVSAATGSYTTNVIVAPAVPSLFSLDSSGTGAAAAINAATGQIVGSAAPLHAGDYVEFFLTGLGQTTRKADGLDWAQNTPTVTLGGQVCKVSYGGRVPGVPGLDQVNCQIPAGLSGAAVPAVVTANGRPSNTVTLAIQ